MEILTTLLDPKVLSLLGPIGLFCILLVAAVIKLYNRTIDLQDRLLSQSLASQREHKELAEKINSTMQTLISMLRTNHD